MAGLKFRILLDSEDKAEIFRDILVADHDTFEAFYHSILDAFHFSGDQMASFYTSNENWDKGEEISLFDMSFGDDDQSPRVMSNTTIRELIETKDQKFILVHDFLRIWIFLIELIEYQQETPDRMRVTLAVGNAPAESSKSDSGETLQFETEPSEEGMDEDEYGFDDFEHGYDDFEY